MSSSFLIFFLAVVLIFFVESFGECFTIDLIHRDSPQSPFYDPSLTKWDRLNASFHRSSYRVYSKSLRDIETRIVPVNEEYVLKLYIGNPRVPQFMVVDTGSFLAWVQCKPCEFCAPKHDPTFDPKYSTTYRDIYCNTPSCNSVLNRNSCESSSNNTELCMYHIIYGDLSMTGGDVGSETFTFKSALGSSIVSIPQVLFGCGHGNFFGFTKFKADGIIGLGRGKESFINQASKYMTRKFSYCLLSDHSSPNATAKISFGNSASVESPGSVTIPLKKNDPSYIIKLESIIVNNVTIFSLREDQNSNINDIDIDSGATFTYLPESLYNKLKLEVQKVIPFKGFKGPTFPLCYKSKEKIIFPKISFKFDGGAIVELPKTGIFTQIDPATVCLAILSIGSGNHGIIGNLAQANSLIGFDLDKNIVSFKPTDCNKL